MAGRWNSWLADYFRRQCI